VAQWQSRKRSRFAGSIAAAVGGVALIVVTLAGFVSLAIFYFSTPQDPTLDPVSLCPSTGPKGITVVLVDTSDDLPDPAQRQVLGLLEDQITSLPTFYKLDIRVLDIAAGRSRSLFSKCNPGDGVGLSEWTKNPRLARLQWIESFQQPAKDAVKNSLASAKANSSPIMAAIQDIAIDQFSSDVVQGIPKTLIVISDMLEYTRDYSQYPSAGDLSYQRFQRSPAYLKFRTDLHGARVTIQYVRRNLPAKFDTHQHMEFWYKWIQENRGVYETVKSLQGVG
jgi:hypothetical protein